MFYNQILLKFKFIHTTGLSYLTVWYALHVAFVLQTQEVIDQKSIRNLNYKNRL